MTAAQAPESLDLLPALDADTAAAIAARAEAPTDKWPAALAAMVDVVTATYARQGLDPEGAARLARTALAALAHYHGGRQYYLPTSDRLDNALRDDDIYRRLSRVGADALAQQYGISSIRVYQIHAEQLAVRRAAMQREMF